MVGVKFRAILSEYKKGLDERLDSFFESKLVEVQGLGKEVGELVLNLKEIGLRGKRLRGFLFMMGYALAQGWGEWQKERFPEKVWQGGMGVELFHLGLLVQDDVMDRDEIRRGVVSLHARYEELHYGEAMANLGADMCFGWAVELLSGIGKVEVLQEWGKYFERVARGQVMDLKTQNYFWVVELKTAEYTGELPLVLGWLVGGRERSEGERLFVWGKNWGRLFQWLDDWDDGDGVMKQWGREKTKEEVKKLGKELQESVAGLGLSEWWQARFREMVEMLLRRID